MAGRIQSCFQRYEKKYMLTPYQYRLMLDGMKPYMRPDEYGQYTLCNIYYDTDNYQLIRDSLEKPVYKEKLRMRSYGVPGDEDNVFVELKKKYKGVVYKRRVTMDADSAVNYLNSNIPPQCENQILHEIDWFIQGYHPKPKVFIAYDREAYAGAEDKNLRITFDTNLRWRDTELDLRAGNYGNALLSPEDILMEIKTPGAVPLWLAGLLSEIGAFPCSFSKYGDCYRKYIFSPLFHSSDSFIKV